MMVSAEPEPPRASTITKTQDMVTIKVGGKGTTYHIHKALLVHHSEYFRKALQEYWREGKDRSVTLDNLDPLAFDVFVDWMYTSKVPQKNKEWLKNEPESTSGDYMLRLEMLRLNTYVVADRLGAKDLLKAVNNNYADNNIEEAPYYQEIIYAFANIPPGRRILRLLSALHCRWSDTEKDKEFDCDRNLRKHLPHDFLLLVIQQYQAWRCDGNWEQHLDACDFHEHSSEREKKQCRLDAFEP